MAQNPFGGPRPAAKPEIGGLIGWILTKQSEFYREISTALRRGEVRWIGVWSLLAISLPTASFTLRVRSSRR